MSNQIRSNMIQDIINKQIKQQNDNISIQTYNCLMKHDIFNKLMEEYNNNIISYKIFILLQLNNKAIKDAKSSNYL